MRKRPNGSGWSVLLGRIGAYGRGMFFRKTSGGQLRGIRGQVLQKEPEPTKLTTPAKLPNPRQRSRWRG